MATSKKGRATPIARKSTAAARAAAATPARLPAASAAAVAVKPTSVAVSAGVGPALQLAARPPLEAALDSFARELRAALDRAVADVAAVRAEAATLRAELTQLRQRYQAHTHTYERSALGGGGHQWIELRFLQSYIDGDQAGYKNYGIWSHGKSTSDAPPAQATSGPSA